MVGDSASLDLPLPLPVPLGDCVVLAIGRRLTMPFCFPEFMTAVPCLEDVAEWQCGE